MATPKTEKKSASKTPIGSKPDTSKINMVQVHCLQGGKKSPYKALTSHRAHFSAFTIAALMVANYVTITAKGAPSKGKKNRQYSMLQGLIGSSAWSHWNGSTERLSHEAGYTDDDGKKIPAVQEITVNGLNCIQARLSGAGKGYNTDMATVNAFKAAIEKGGKHVIDKVSYDFAATQSFKKQ